MDVTKLTLSERIVLAVGALLAIDLLFLPWHSIDIGGLIPGVDTTRSGVQSPNGGYAVSALIITFLMIGQIVASKLMSANLPDPAIPWSQVHLVAAVLGFGAYLGLALAAALVFGGYGTRQEAARGPA